MLWKLVANEPIRVEIKGVAVYVKPLTVGQRAVWLDKIRNLQNPLQDWDAYCELLSEKIDRIEGYEGTIVDLLKRVEEPAVALEIQTAIWAQGGVDEKNSGCSSGSQPTSPTSLSPAVAPAANTKDCDA